MSFAVFDELFLDIAQHLDISEDVMKLGLVKAFERMRVIEQDSDEGSDTEDNTTDLQNDSMSDEESMSDNEEHWVEEEQGDFSGGGLKINRPTYYYMFDTLSAEHFHLMMTLLLQQYGKEACIGPREVDLLICQHKLL
jgi:hypothetical protein